MKTNDTDYAYINHLIQKLEKILENPSLSGEAITQLLAKEQPYTVAVLLNSLMGDRVRVVLALPVERHSEVLDLVSTHTLRNIMSRLPDHELVRIIDQSHPTLKTKILRHIERSRIERIGPKLVAELRARLLLHANYPKRSVGYIMQMEFPVVVDNATITDARNVLRTIGPTIGPIHQVYLVDEKGDYVGLVPIAKLVVAIGTDKILPLAIRTLPTLSARSSQTRAAQIFQDFDLVEVPVLENDQPIGRVLVESIFDVIQQEFTEDIQKLSGITGGDETLETAPVASSRRRLPWMIVNVFLALLAVTAVMPFQDIIGQVTALAVLMPIISNMGGNVGIQALAVSVRSTSTGHGTWRLPLREFGKEVKVGLINGLTLGGILGLIAWLGWRNPYLGVVVTISMFINTIVASVIGGILPIFLKKMKLDPALMSGALLTTIIDFTGFLIFLSLAKNLLPYLIS